MIRDFQEPKGLSPDTAPLDSVVGDKRKLKDATVGSRRLLDAILLAKGIEPPPVVREIRPAFKPAVCPVCYAPSKPLPLFVSHIQETVAAYFGLNAALMVSDQRGRKIAGPRQIAMYLSSELTPKSLCEIGRRFRRDHTTVMHAIKAVERRMDASAEVLLDVEVLRERLAAMPEWYPHQ